MRPTVVDCPSCFFACCLLHLLCLLFVAAFQSPAAATHHGLLLEPSNAYLLLQLINI
jgi:hypothetical protein